MLYHPDKHRDPELKRQAEQLFNFVHEAYEGWKSPLFNTQESDFKYTVMFCLYTYKVLQIYSYSS